METEIFSKVRVYQVFSNNWQICSFYRKEDAEKLKNLLDKIKRAEAFRNSEIKISESSEYLSEKQIENIKETHKIEIQRLA
jgi:hypothetical protein